MKLVVIKRRLIVALYVIFMMVIALPTIFYILQWNITAGETFFYKEEKFINNFMVYILEPLIVMAYLYFVYVTTASLWFYLKYKDFGAKCHSKCQNGTLKFSILLSFVLYLLYNKAQKKVNL